MEAKKRITSSTPSLRREAIKNSASLASHRTKVDIVDGYIINIHQNKYGYGNKTFSNKGRTTDTNLYL